MTRVPSDETMTRVSTSSSGAIDAARAGSGSGPAHVPAGSGGRKVPPRESAPPVEIHAWTLPLQTASTRTFAQRSVIRTASASGAIKWQTSRRPPSATKLSCQRTLNSSEHPAASSSGIPQRLIGAFSVHSANTSTIPSSRLPVSMIRMQFC
jgi:hypothetical protein